MTSKPAATNRSTRQNPARRLQRLQPPRAGESRCWNGGNIWRNDGGARRSWPALCFSRSLADTSVKGRYKDGSERNAGLAGFSVLNTSGPGEVGPEVGDRPAGVPVGGAERSAGGVWSWHRACCSCWALRWWEGSSWRAAARGGGGSQEEEEAVLFREGVTGRKGTEKTREEVENWGGCQP